MCEILCLIGLWKYLGNTAEEKGRPAIWFQLMGIGLWFGGEIVGFIAGFLITGGEAELTAYACALGGAVVGAVLSVVVVMVLPAEVPPPRYPPMPVRR